MQSTKVGVYVHVELKMASVYLHVELKMASGLNNHSEVTGSFEVANNAFDCGGVRLFSFELNRQT